MSVYLRLRSESDSIALNQIYTTGYGTEALNGVTGMGLPPVSTQWITGAGDGATYRGTRVQTRDIDIPLYLFYPDREQLKAQLQRLALVFAGPLQLDLVEDGVSEYWTTRVVRVSGGDFTYGSNDGTLGETEFRTVVTVRAGDPFFTSSRTSKLTISNAGAGRGLLAGSLVSMEVSASQAIGTMTIINTGDAKAYPVWDVTGPGTDLTVTLPNGNGFKWQGTLADGESLHIDTRTAAVYGTDPVTDNRYGDLAPAPYFFPIPPGTTVATVSMDGTNASSSITCLWSPRKWWVI